MTTEKAARIEVNKVGVKPMFEKWISERAGVIVWNNHDLSNPGAGCMFTPATTINGGAVDKELAPHWAYRYGETVTDLARFRFVKEVKEVKRFRVAVRSGGNGLKVKCTDASSRKIKAACAKFSTEKGSAVYEFDYNTQEAVILVAVWED